MGVIISGQEFGKQVADIFGLQGHKISDISIDISARGAARITFTQYIEREQADKLGDLIAKNHESFIIDAKSQAQAREPQRISVLLSDPKLTDWNNAHAWYDHRVWRVVRMTGCQTVHPPPPMGLILEPLGQ